MRKLLYLYLSYLKISIISMLAATIILPLCAAIFTGKLSPVSGTIIFVTLLGVTCLLVLRFFKYGLTSILPRRAEQDTQIRDIEKSTEMLESSKAADSANPIQPQISRKPLKRTGYESRTQEKREKEIIKEALLGIDIETNDQEVVSPNLPFSLVKPSTEFVPSAKIKVVGIGGGGNNAVSWMVDAGVIGVEFLAVNTDMQALKYARAHRKLQIGAKLTRGLGVGGDPKVGREAALEDTKQIADALKGLDMVFLTAGLGGGTGTGAIPIFARVAKELGILTVAVVTKPFDFEGNVRRTQAEEGLLELRSNVDTLITIDNDRLLDAVTEQTPLLESFRLADDVLRQAVQGISDIITIPGLINVDYADVKTIMSGKGVALMGIGQSTGLFRAIRAVKQVVNSPLLEGASIGRAKGLLINITGSEDLTLHEVNDAMMRIQQIADPEANIIFGAVVDEELTNEIKITVIATGFQDEAASEDISSGVPRQPKLIHQEDTRLLDYKRKKAK